MIIEECLESLKSLGTRILPSTSLKKNFMFIEGDDTTYARRYEVYMERDLGTTISTVGGMFNFDICFYYSRVRIGVHI